jgi:hypothetical protein
MRLHGKGQGRYTHGCAKLLRLTAEELRLQRRMIAAAAESAGDAVAAREAAKLARQGN